MNSFYTEEELLNMGFKSIGNKVMLSRKCSIYFPNKICIGDNVRIDDFCILSGKITIGNNVHISAGSLLYGGEDGIVIEDFVGISSRVAIYSITDDYSGEYMTNSVVKMNCRNILSKIVILRKHSIIGTGSTILPGVIIEEGCAIGCMSLVKGTTEKWKIYAGIPVKVIDNRSRALLNLERINY